ncbi:MAG: class I SAM-dependent methyltransferase [Planctomycetes bacterium]|nr:class I SAM-dependent methyltransferase [Planctomycetota bacterium]
MSGALLIAEAAAGAGGRRAPTVLQRRLRDQVVHRLRRLSCGAIRLTDHAGEMLLGDPTGPLGTAPLVVHDPAFWTALVFGADLAAGEGFVSGQWSSDDLVRLLQLFVRDREVRQQVGRSPWSWPRRLLRRAGQLLRQNHRRGSERNIRDHYDLGDELFAHMLDPSMTYSSAWFEYEGQPLAATQQHKLQRLGDLVDLGPGDHLLEIGTGWGSLALFAARRGARVVTTTISHNQFTTTQQRLAQSGLGDRVQLLRRDYRDLDGTFDKLLSCEMIEAVGARFLPTYLRTCAARLRAGGLLGLQAITIQDRLYHGALRSVDYIKRHVFPGSFIPSVAAIVDAAARHSDLQLEHYTDFGPHYATTLRCWRERITTAPEPFLRRGGPALLRAWVYYLAYCEAGFRERQLGVGHFRFRRGRA